MSKSVIFIADVFADEVLGGGELNNEELIGLLTKSGYTVSKMKSHVMTPSFIQSNPDSFYIVSNFIRLDQASRSALMETGRYVIYEHDHKYLASRNPATYSYFHAPAAELRNYFFYKNAQRVICQSNFHKEIIEKNLEIDTVLSVGGNLWSIETLEHLRQNAQKSKEDKCSIMNSPIPHKNTAKAAAYCNSNGLTFDLVADSNPIAFVDKLGKNKTFVFFPGTPETLSRIVVEARMMGMGVKTNALVGATSEDWFALKGIELIDVMTEKRSEINNIFINEIEAAAQQGPQEEYPEVSIITTFFEGDGFLDDFLDNITKQTIINKCEVVIVDTGSQGDEAKTIRKYQQAWPQIKYVRTEERLKPTVGLNMAIKNSTGKYLTFAFLDDRKSLECVETLLAELRTSPGTDLVYGECLTTKVKNETFEDSSSTEPFEHSTFNFSRENMIKCLPGPMPMWRREVHEQHGLLDQDNCDYADDWEMWLRAVSGGAKFKKVDKAVGLYFEGGRSQQLANTAQRKEEAQLFYKYAHLFGANFYSYKPYFDQFV